MQPFSVLARSFQNLLCVGAGVALEMLREYVRAVAALPAGLAMIRVGFSKSTDNWGHQPLPLVVM